MGPVDLMTDADLAHDVEAVVSERLTNAIRHAETEAITVEIAIEGATIKVTVTDDGVGPGTSPRHGGSSSIRPGDTGGAVLRWQANLGR